MANTKISALPASTTPLAGTEVLPIVQSTTTKQVSVANLTAGRAVATGALTVTGAATVSSTLGVTGAATLSSTLGVTGAATLSSSLGVAGATTLFSVATTSGTIATAPSGSTDIANKAYVDTVAQGLDTKASVVAGTTANITLSGTQTIDGVVLIAGDRVLVKNQTTTANNGLYLCAAGSWTRTTDMDTWAEVPGAYVFVEQGTTLADTGWVCTSDAGGTIGVTAIVWAQFSGAGSGVSSINFGSTGLTPSSVTTGAVTVAGTLAVANGGTGITSFGTGIATFLGTPSSANLAAALTDETGTGVAVFATNPVLVTPNLGTPSAAVLTSATGLPLTTGVTGLLPVANGGTGTATPSIVAGTNVTVSGTWPNQTINSTASGTGDVVGPASSTDNAFARFDSTTGKLLQNSTATLSDTGAAVFTGALDVLGNSTAGSNLKLYEDTDNGTNYVSFKAPDTIAANVTWTLPAADGTSAQVLSTNGSGTLSWATAGSSQWTTTGSDIYYNTGNVGIGTTSPVANFRLTASNSVDTTGGIYIENTSTGTGGSAVARYKNSGTVVAFTGVGGTGRSSYAGLGANVLAMYTDSNAGLALTVDNSGGSITFNTNSTEAARITSGGSFLVGATSTGNNEKLGIYQSSTSAGLFINPTNASYSGTALYINTTTAATSGFDLIGCYANNVGQFRVGGNGVIYAQNTSVQSISDQRLKENISDSTDGLAVVNALRPVRYDWKEGYGNDQKNQLGFIAQEVETVFPEAVSEWKVNKIDETVYKTVGPSALIPVLVKAIQEQQALITTLTERITALEGV